MRIEDSIRTASEQTATIHRALRRRRGVMLAENDGEKASFARRCHAWAYDLEGALRSVPADEAFPDPDGRAYRLVPVQTQERSGLVFVTLLDLISDGAHGVC